MSYRNFLLGSVALAAISITGASLAQDTADGFSWNGAYMGADVGIGIGSMHRDYVGDPSNELSEFSLGSEALQGGVFAGYDYEVAPGLVFGIEAGLDFFNSEGSLTSATYADSYEFRSLGAAHAGVRVGAEIAPRTLVYGRLAYAAIHAQASIVPADDAEQEFLNGYQAAIGLESEVTENVTLRVEGTYTKAVDRLTIGETDTYAYTPSHFGAQVGVAYRFGAEQRGERVDLAPMRSWNGGYIGGMVGGLATSSINGGPGFELVGTEGPASTIVAAYGAYAGVNIQVGDQWVAGVEGEISKYNAGYDATGLGAYDAFDFASSDYKGQVSGRLGYLVNPDTLVYGRAGYGLMHINPDTTDYLSPVGVEDGLVSTASVGVGVETMLNEHALVRVEGLYSAALDDYRFPNASDGNPSYYVKPNSVEARIGAAYMF